MRVNKTSIQKTQKLNEQLPQNLVKARLAQFAATKLGTICHELAAKGKREVSKTSSATPVFPVDPTPANTIPANNEAAWLMMYIFLIISGEGGKPNPTEKADIEKLLGKLKALLGQGFIQPPLLGIVKAFLKQAGSASSPDWKKLYAFLTNEMKPGSDFANWVQKYGLPAMKHINPIDFADGAGIALLFEGVMMVLFDGMFLGGGKAMITALLNFIAPMGGNMSKTMQELILAYFMEKDTKNGKVDWGQFQQDVGDFEGFMMEFCGNNPQFAALAKIFGNGGSFEKLYDQMFPNGPDKPGQWPTSSWGPPDIIFHYFCQWFNKFIQQEFPNDPPNSSNYAPDNSLQPSSTSNSNSSSDIAPPSTSDLLDIDSIEEQAEEERLQAQRELLESYEKIDWFEDK